MSFLATSYILLPIGTPSKLLNMVFHYVGSSLFSDMQIKKHFQSSRQTAYVTNVIAFILRPWAITFDTYELQHSVLSAEHPGRPSLALAAIVAAAH
jgi:hypothetical protein